MVAFVSGGSLGLSNTSLALLGRQGMVGDASLGRAGEGIYINTATGNLVIQHEDELLKGIGPDSSLLRTYNSLGARTDDNGDNWQFNAYKSVDTLTGAINTAGSTVVRTDGDGTRRIFTFDSQQGLYVNKDNAGAFDTLSYANNAWTWTQGATRMTESYDWNGSVGKMVAMADADGNKLTYQYTGNLITAVTDASGETTYLDYVGNKLMDLRVVRSDGAEWTRVRYEYDASNRLSKITVDLSPSDNSIADGKTFVTTYSYVGASTQLASISESDGSSIVFNNYDAAGRITQLTQTVSGVARVTKLTYESGQTTVTDPLGNTTIYSYDAAGRLTTLFGPAIDGATRQTFKYSYNSNGHLATQTDGNGNGITYDYDANGNRTFQRDGLGNTVTRVFGAKNELLSESVYPAAGGAALTTRYAYDGNGHLRFIVTAEGRVTEYRYNSRGQRTDAIDYTDSRYTGSAFDAASLATWVSALADKSRSLRTETVYDARGQVARETRWANVDANGNGITDGKQSVMMYFHDQAGLLFKKFNLNNGTTYNYTYDGMGRVLTATDALGNVTLTKYDDANNKTVVTLANGLATTYAYDAAGELLSIVQANGATALGTTSYAYDKNGRLCMKQDPTGVKQYCLYDEAGRKVAEVDGTGSLTEYVYDANSNLVRQVRYNTSVSSVNLTALSNASGIDIKLSTICPAAISNTLNRSTWNLYDAAGRLVKTIDELGYVTETQYDGANRMTAVIRYAKPVDAANITNTTKPADAAATPAVDAVNDRHTRYFYDADGKLVGTLDAEGALSENIYDGAGRLQHTIAYAKRTNSTLWASGTLAQLRPASNAQDLHYWKFYDGRSQVIAEVDGEGAVVEYFYNANGNRVQQTSYVNRSRIAPNAITTSTLLAAVRPVTDARDAISYWTYIGTDQVQTYTRPEGSVTKYAYDAVGNLIRTDHASGTFDQRAIQARYDVQGRVVAELSGVGSAALAQLNAPTQAQIDAIWNQYGTQYAYDAAGRKISATDPNGNKTRYYYDADGQPIYTINAAGEVTQNTWDALSNLTQVKRYGARLSATAMAALAGGLVTSAVTNTISALANAAVDSVVSYTYDVRGEVVTKSDTIANVSYAYNAFAETTTTTTAINSSVSTATQTTYDRRGLVTQVMEDSGTGGIQRKTGYAYDSFGNKTARTDANGNLTRYFYDRDNRLKYTLDALGGVVRMDYDTEGRIIKNVAYAAALKGIPTSAQISDIESKLVLDPAHDSVLNQLYDKDGRLVFTVSGNGTVTQYSYDARGNVTRVQAYAKPLAAGTALTFDAVSAVVQTPEFASAGDAITRSAYDADNRLIWQADGTGAVSTWKYDNAGNLIEEIGYANRLTGILSKVISGSLPAADLARDRHVRRVYDAANREIAFAVAQKTDAANNLQWTVTKKVLDTQGRVVQQTVGANYLSSQTLAAQPTQAQVATWINSLAATTLDAVERYAYDVAGHLVYKVDAVNTVTQFSYDQASNLTQKRTYATAVTLSNGVLTQSQIATALTNKTSAADQVDNFVYDALGRVVYTIDASGYAVKKTYDAFGNVMMVRSYAKTIALPSSPSVASVDAAVANAYAGDSAAAAADRIEGRVYDADNRLLYKIDSQGYVTGTTYDGLGRIASTTRYATQLASSFITNASQLKPVIYATALATPSGAQQNDRTDTFAYDAAGNLIESRDPMGGTERFTYDALGRKLSFTNKLGKTWNYQYDAAGRLMLEIAPAVAVAQGSWTTDANGNATYSALPSVDIALQTKIDYDAFGNVKARTEAYGTSQQRTTSYDYNAVGRQVKVIYPPVDVYNAAADTARTTTMTEVVQKGVTPTDTVIYDALGNAVVHTDAAGNNSYKVYDNAGRVRYEVDAKGYITGYARDVYGQVTTLTRYGVAMGIASQGAKPFTLAAVQAFVTASTTSHATDRVVTTQYDTLGHVIKVTEPQAEVWDSYGTNGSYFTAGKTTETTYNAFGEALKVSVYGQNASGTRVTAAADTYYSWNNLGQKVAEFNSADVTVTTSSNWSATGYLTRMDYDAAGNLKTRTEYSAALTITDSAWNAVTGLAMPAAKAAAQDSPNRVTAYAYDLNGRLTEETRKNVAYMSVEGTTVTSDLKTRYGYDAVGNRTSVTDALGNTTYTYYDALGRVIAVASPPTARQRAQIAQIYLALLGRAPESGGLTYWVGRLQSGASMLQVAREIYGSAEAQGVFAGVSDSAFLTALYKGLFTSEPDSSWVSLRSSALSKDVKAGKAVGEARAQAAVSIIEDAVALAGSDAAVMNSKVTAALSFADSGSNDLNAARSTANSAGVAAGLRVQVAQLFVAILNRSPAAEGLADGLKVYPSSLSPTDFVIKVYQVMIGRNVTASDDGVKYWVNQLGSSTRGQVLVNIRNSFLSITDSFQSNKRDYLQKVFNVLNGMKSTAAGMTLDTRVAALNTAAANAAKTADAAAVAAAAGIAPQSALAAMRLYVLLMNKLPSSSTLIAYAKQLASGQTPAAVAANILASSEGAARYPASMTATSFVATIYQGVLGRLPASTENSQWITALSSKPRGQVAADMVAYLTGYSGTDPQILASANLYAGKVNSWLNGVIAATQAAFQNSLATVNEIDTIAARTLIDLVPSLPAPDLLADPSAAVAAASPRTTRTFDRWGNVATVTDPRNAAWVTRYTWNSADQLTSVSGAQVFDAAKNALVTPTTTTGYDALGRQVAGKDANGNLTRQVWDASGNLVRTLQADGGIESNRFDALGNRTWHRSAAGTTDEFAYDKLGHLTQVTRAARLGVDKFKTVLDSIGQVTLSFDKREAVTESWSWDELGQRISHTDGAGQTDKTFYDLRGNIVRTVDANQNNATRYAFDAWGHKTGQQDADGNLMTWAWNWNAAESRFRQDSHQDLGKARVSYTWNFLNQLKTQTSTGGSHAAQDLVYTYDASSGLLTKIEDRAQIWGNAASPNATKVTQYAYDLAGNRIRERTAIKSNGKEVGVFQDNHLAYDALNRLTDAADERYRMKIEYDANGNRVHVNTTYVADGGKDPTTVDAWNAFDAMNRQTIVDGKKDIASGKIVIDTVKDGGVQLSYDNDGRRIMARQWGLRLKSTTQMTFLQIDRREAELVPVVTWGTEAGFVAESYTYDGAGRLADTWRDGIDIDHRQYDAASRVVGSGASGIAAMAAQAASNVNLSKALNEAGIATDQKTTQYDAAGRQQNQTLKSLDGSTVTKISNGYDKSGNLTSAKVEQAGSTVNYQYSYTGGEFDSKKLKTVTVKQSGMTDASTTNSYDALGNLVKTQISRNGKLIQRDFINDANGQALKQVDEQGITRTLIVNDQVQGSTSASGNTFRSGYEPLTDAALTGGPSTYTVQADGQTLQNVAQALWGDASLWYLIADANGLGNMSLTKGQVLVIPAKGSAGGNTYQTFKPYDASKVMGDITPQGMPLPQGSGGGCGGVGAILTVVVAIVATVVTAGAAAIAMGAVEGVALGTASLSTILATGGSVLGLVSEQVGVG